MTMNTEKKGHLSGKGGIERYARVLTFLITRGNYMKKYAMITAVVTALMFFLMPAGTVSAQDRDTHRRHSGSRMNPVRWPQGKGDPRWAGSHRDDRSNRNRHGRRGDYFGYRNYGQYRRTQVGNRRHRYTRHHNSWQSDGFIRRSRRSY